MTKKAAACSRGLHVAARLLAFALGVSLPVASHAAQIVLTSGTTWTVPNDWNSANNTVEVIGGGGGGAGGSTPSYGSTGGGGGAYSKISNLSLAPGSSVGIQIGGAGSAGAINIAGGAGGDTFFCNSSSNCGSISGTAVVVGAKGGVGGLVGTGAGLWASGGASGSGIGSTKYSGGNSGAQGNDNSATGGGGAAGPAGAGGVGGNINGPYQAGSGGGGANGGANGGAVNAANTAGAGGNNAGSTGGGVAGGGAGSSGGGGGGGNSTTEAGGAGSTGGVSGGGGGGGYGQNSVVAGPGGNGGGYGGGGGGGGGSLTRSAAGGAGSSGVVVITYLPTVPYTPPPPTSATRTSSFGYDSASGLLTQEVVEPDNSALRLQTDYVYDTFGHKVSVTVSGADISTRGSTTAYDAKGEFVSTNTNAIGQSESWQYDPRFGMPTSHTGPNGLTTTWSYDGFGRKILEVRADGTQTKWAYLFCSGVNGGTATCPSGASYLTQMTPLAADGVTPSGPTLLVYFDLLDREIARDTQGFDGSTLRAVKQYNALGQVSKISRPYFLASGTPQWTTPTYDALGRTVSVTMPDGSVSQTAYHGLFVTETNALGQTRTVTKNSQGQVVMVTDALGKTMTYAYDAFGNMTQTTDAVGNVVAATYDTRGRKIASSDPDLGTWTYTYNTLSQLVSQTDAKGQSTSLTYDKLDRVVQRVEADMTSQWVYDSAANGIGKLATTGITAGAGAGFQRSVSYDTLGRPVQVATTIDGATYAMGASYDANSRLATIAYPSGFTARYAYNNLGYANQLSDAGTNQVHWTANAMDADGHLTQQTAGNGLVTTRSFDVTTGRLMGVTTGTGNAVQNLSYTYDRLGNPLSRSDANTSLSENFTYDSLNRLTSTTVNLTPTPLAKTFTYDSVGNMLSKSDLGNYSYAPPGSPLPHAVTAVSGGAISTTFAYDPNGNQTSGLGRSISYTSYNKPASITQGARTISFLDDSDHQRFKQVTPEGATLYIAAFGVLAELSSPGATGQRWTDYLSVGNAKVGMRVIQTAAETITTRYFHTDHLGSISVITNENGVVQERLSYDAWGRRRLPNGTDDTTGGIASQTTRGFTGEEELTVAGLVHLNGRVYDPLLARMTSADPTVTDPMNAQGWNRYSYVGNDPLAFTDPNGFSWFSSFFHSISNAISSAWNAVTNFVRSNPIVKAIVQIVATVVLNTIIPGSAVFVAVASAAGGAAIATGLSGGNLGQILKASAIAGATAFALNGVGDFTGHTPAFGTAAYAENIAGHALVGCASSAASGGSCESGALSGAVGSALSPATDKLFPDARTDFSQRIGGTIVEATAGGLASVAGGGKFANGAITGAFGYLFNRVAATFDRATGQLTVKDLDTGETVMGKFFSGGFGGDAIPDGAYSILERAGKNEFRLEAQDGTFGDDRVDGSGGRGLFRLHGPGITNGCIAACDAETWDSVSKLINGTSTTNTTVNRYLGGSFLGGTLQPFRIPRGTEILRDFGTLRVQ